MDVCEEVQGRNNEREGERERLGGGGRGGRGCGRRGSGMCEKTKADMSANKLKMPISL